MTSTDRPDAATTDSDRADVFELDDPLVADLSNFLLSAPLSDGTRTRMYPGNVELVSQAVLNWLNGLVYDGGEWVPRAQIEVIPDFGEVETTTLSDGEAVKMRHLPTGVVAIGVDAHEAWKQLRCKVMEVTGDA
ncbi:hypothetical protein [Prescottella equi]|uniref:Uncharacterized protein n=1 Tax=Prescottella equi ATCC 33707 TaxID=525370 RepID=E9T061_RHOHA|nr:hypothetical protein [Prescottella equi]EGD24644.1 hypothetical protein HMPREF0724_11762 [Prescottella equi ATCC 33707]